MVSVLVYINKYTHLNYDHVHYIPENSIYLALLTISYALLRRNRIKKTGSALILLVHEFLFEWYWICLCSLLTSTKHYCAARQD